MTTTRNLHGLPDLGGPRDAQASADQTTWKLVITSPGGEVGFHPVIRSSLPFKNRRTVRLPAGDYSIEVQANGFTAQLLGVDAIRELNVVTGACGANYGQRNGAQVSIVTQSGTHQLHALAYEFLRNSTLDARNHFDRGQISEFQRNNFGTALGWPLRRNRVFLFGSYEGYRQKLGLSDVTLVPDDGSPAADSASAQPLLALWPVANGPELGSGIAEAFSSPTQRVRENFGARRVDATLSPADSFVLMYTINDGDATTPSANPLSGIYESLREQVLSAQEEHIVSSNLLNMFRVSYSRGADYFTGEVPGSIPGWVTGKPIGALVIAGSTASNGSSQVTGAGGNRGSNSAAVRNLFTAADHVYWSHGHRQVQAGIWLQRIQASDNLAQNQYGQAFFTVVPARTEPGWRSLEGAAFVQDIRQATSRLEVRAGFRFESTNGWREAQCRASNYGFSDGVINTDPTVRCSALATNRAKFLSEPRLVVAWDVFGNGKTAVRTGFGIYRMLLDNLDYRLDETAPFNTSLTLQKVAPSGLSIAPGLTTASGGKVSPSNGQADLYAPSVLAWSVKTEQQIGQGTSLTVGYEGSHGYPEILSEDENEPASVICPSSSCPGSLAAGSVYYPTTANANPSLANTTSWVSEGVSNYDALEAEIRHRFTHGVQLRGLYTRPHNLDDGSAWNTSVSANTPAYVGHPADPNVDYGDAATDIRSVAAINGTWEPPRRIAEGWSLSGVASLQSGFTFSPQFSYNPTGSGDSRNPVRSDVNPSFIGNPYWDAASQWFNSAAFLAPASGAVGSLGRDTLRGPDLEGLDLVVVKTTTIHKSISAQFRAESFNILNHSNFTTPNPAVYPSGPKPGSATAAPVLSPTAGVITATATTSRQISVRSEVAV